jgi:hypothetical protein
MSSPTASRVIPGLILGALSLLSAFLLFQVQPIISKFILPWFGGSPGVWTTCMLFFQIVLFAGYAYAHTLTLLPRKWQGILHGLLLGAAIALAGLPAIYSVTTEGYFSEQAAWRLGNTVAVGSGAIIVNHALAKYKGGALQGTLRGNAITCLVLVGIDTGYAFVEFGGTKAFNGPEFYERLGGGLGATALGFAVGTPVATYATVLAAETGPFAPAIGITAGVASGMAAGALGYVGGEKVTRFGLTVFAPQMLLESDLSGVRSARGELEANLAQLSAP